MWHKNRLIAPLLALLALATCARPRTIKVEELRSKILSAISLASETELLIVQVENNRTTRHFEMEHANYLRREAVQLSKGMSQSRMDSTDVHNLRVCSEQLDLLARELTALKMQSDNKPGLAATGERVENIRKSLEAEMAGL